MRLRLGVTLAVTTWFFVSTMAKSDFKTWYCLQKQQSNLQIKFIDNMTKIVNIKNPLYIHSWLTSTVDSFKQSILNISHLRKWFWYSLFDMNTLKSDEFTTVIKWFITIRSVSLLIKYLYKDFNRFNFKISSFKKLFLPLEYRTWSNILKITNSPSFSQISYCWNFLIFII